MCDDRVAECRNSRSPLRLMNAEPSVPELKGAPFGNRSRNTFVDEERGIAVEVLGRKGNNVELFISYGSR